jgi:hypothetical protein
VEVLGGAAHDERALVDDLLGDDPRVGVDALAHRVAAHVLDTTGDRDIDGPEPDRGGDIGDSGHRTGTHPVDRVARGRVGQTGEQRSQAAEGQALVADLGRRGDRDLLDLVLRQVRIATEQLTDALDDEVVGPGLGVDPFLTGLAERGADPVDKDDLTQGTGHAGCLLGQTVMGQWWLP